MVDRQKSGRKEEWGGQRDTERKIERERERERERKRFSREKKCDTPMFEPGHAASDQSPTVAGNFRWPTRGLFGALPHSTALPTPPLPLLSLSLSFSLSAHTGASSSRWGERMGERTGREAEESRGATMEGRWAADYEAPAHQAQARQKNRKTNKRI